MIGKINPGKGYAGTITYVLGPGGDNVEGRAEVLYHTMSSENPEHWAVEMKEHAQALNPDLVAGGRADLVVHVSLSAAPGERLSEAQWLVVAHEYMQQMGWGSHDYIAVRHSDRPHDHIHLIVNRVGQDGKTADLHNDYQRQAAVLERLEKQFGLEQSHSQMRHAAEADPSKAIEAATKSHLTFTAHDVEKYFTRLGFDDDKAKELTGKALEAGNVLGMADGRYTTAEIRTEVSDLNDRFAALAGRAHAALSDLAPSINPDRPLSTDQERAREAIARGDDLTVIHGYAGAGKSTLLDQARADLEQSGYRVIGAAPTGKAADGLQASSHIESSTLASLIGSIKYGSVTFDSKTVLVVDEAAMARIDDISAVADAIQSAGGRLILVGDNMQLQAVGHGGAFDLAEQHVKATILSTIWRQADTLDSEDNVIDSRAWMRAASQAFGEGRTADAIQAYADHGDIKWSASAGSSIRDLVLDYAEAVDNGRRPDQMLAMAYRNNDVDKLNAAIRDELKERGLLQDARTYDLTRGGGEGDIELATGDRVVLLKNEKGLGVSKDDVKNGMFGTVVATWPDDTRVTIQFDKGSVVTLDLNEYGYIDHGYASTFHKAQSATIIETFGLYTAGMDSHLTAVGATRHSEHTTWYANAVDFKGLEDMKEELSKSRPLEKFNEILKASLEQKLTNAYGMDKQQIAQYLKDHPDVVARLEAMGIMGPDQRTYLQDVGDILEKYGFALEATFQSHFGPQGYEPPGALATVGCSLLDFAREIAGPPTPTQWAISNCLEFIATALELTILPATELGLKLTSMLFELAAATFDHGCWAAEDMLGKLADAVLAEVQKGHGAVNCNPNWTDMPAGPEVDANGFTAGERRFIELWEAGQPPDWKEYWKQCGAVDDYRDMIAGVYNPVQHGLEPDWSGGRDADQGDGTKPGHGREHDGGDKPGASPGQGSSSDKGAEHGQGNSGDKWQGHDESGQRSGRESEQGTDARPAPGRSGGQGTSDRAAADPSASNDRGNELDGGTTPHSRSGQGQEREAGDKPGASPSQGNSSDKGSNQPSSAGGSKGAEQGGTGPSEGSRQGQGQGQQGSNSGRGADQSAGPSSGSSGGRAEATPGQGKPANEKSGQTKPGNAKPGQEKPGSNKSGQSKPGQGKPTKEKSGSNKPGATKLGNEKPGGGKPTATKSGQEKTGTGKPGSNKPGATKPGQGSDKGQGQGNSNSKSSGNDKGYGRERYR